jgi:hypothetical protein
MAAQIFPGRENETLFSLITNPKLQTYAIEAKKLFSQLLQLKVWEIQYKREGNDDNAFYVGMNNKSNPYLLNFKIIPSNLCIEFRFSQYLPTDTFELLKWQFSSWRYADLKTFGI